MSAIRIVLFIFFILSGLTAGCEQKNPLSEYGDALISSYEKGKRGGEEANLKIIRDAVKAYHAGNGHYPESLKEVESMMGSPVNPDIYQYNPETGEIKLKE